MSNSTELRAKLKYGFFKNPELHPSQSGDKPWSDLFIDTFEQVLSIAKSRAHDIQMCDENGNPIVDQGGKAMMNNKRVLFFIEMAGADGEQHPEYESYVADTIAKLRESDLDMSPGQPYLSDTGETRIAFVVHPLKGSTQLQPCDY